MNLQYELPCTSCSGAKEATIYMYMHMEEWEAAIGEELQCERESSVAKQSVKTKPLIFTCNYNVSMYKYTHLQMYLHVQYQSEKMHHNYTTGIGKYIYW